MTLAAPSTQLPPANIDQAASDPLATHRTEILGSDLHASPVAVEQTDHRPTPTRAARRLEHADGGEADHGALLRRAVPRLLASDSPQLRRLVAGVDAGHLREEARLLEFRHGDGYGLAGDVREVAFRRCAPHEDAARDAGGHQPYWTWQDAAGAVLRDGEATVAAKAGETLYLAGRCS